MSFGFLNAVMLAGLAALLLPVVVHLLSKRRYDVVPWGAMQFLELGRRTRRRVRLQDLLLLAVRMGVLALLVAGMARPWAKGGVLGRFAPAERRDVVLVIDGSYSMGWEGNGVTPRAAAIQFAHEVLDELSPGDSVMLLDAREAPYTVLPSPTSDLPHSRRLLDALPPPAGTSRLAAAAAEAVQRLALATHTSRHVILLTDGQALPWQVEGNADWLRFDDLKRQLPVEPQVFAIDVTGGAARDRPNLSVDPLVLSRELTVPGVPIRIRTTIRQSGGETSRCEVSLHVNGQRLEEQTTTITVPANGQAPVEFEHRFDAVGSYVMSVAVEPDALPGDDRSHAAVVVDPQIRVLLVNGDPQSDPVRDEVFFLRSAFAPAGSRTPWVTAETVDWREWQPAALVGQAVVFLCNVPGIDDAQRTALQEFVAGGGGLVIAPGDKVQPGAYAVLAAAGLLPMHFAEQRHEQDFTLRPILPDTESLQAGWLSRFHGEMAIDLAQIRFGAWWRLVPIPAGAGASGREAAPRIEARLKTLDPLVCSKPYGRGAVVQLAVPLDADWSTLPSKNDYVPFVHELVFSLLGRSTGRNVQVGMPLRLALREGELAGEWSFTGPDDVTIAGRIAAEEAGRTVELPSARLAGIYEASLASDRRRKEYFVAATDRSESDLTPLTAVQRQQIARERGISFVERLDDYRRATRAEAEPTELWRWLLLAVLAGLVVETLVTRRLVRRGHTDVGESAAEPLTDGARPL